jgi:hypothetical protein
MPKYLLSRGFDPVLGVFTGFLAYYLSETNPRTNVQPGHTLLELIPWQWREFRSGRESRMVEKDRMDEGGGADWEGLRKEFEADGKK